MTPPSPAVASPARPRRTRAGAASAGTAAGRRASAPRAPRRVSGPSGGRGAQARQRQARIELTPDALAASGRLAPVALAQRALASSSLRSLQDRLAGRPGIALVAFALIGIVTLQLGLLKLNGGIGRALEHEALLQRENAALSIENSEMAAGDRVELSAARIGMEYVPPGSLRSLTVHPGNDAKRAASILRAPVSAGALGETGESGSVGASSATGESTSAQSGASSPEESSASASGEQGASSSGGEAQTPSSQGAQSNSEAPAGAPSQGHAQPAESSAAGGTSTPEGPAG